jgi:putative aldouronate transport system permease protein
MSTAAVPLRPRRRRLGVVLRDEHPLYLFLVPGVVITFLFAYLPMFSNVIAFMDYDISAGWLGLASPFVGFKWFAQIFKDPRFFQLVGRTLYYSVAVLIVSVPAPFILAMLMNELRSKAFKRTVQTISYLPHFISWVTLASLIYLFLSSDTSGILNNIREVLGAKSRIIFMKYPKNFPFVLSLSSVYKEMGWGSIIYLAAISALDVELYEAAAIDGAGRWKQFKHITFPGVLPTTMILLIFAMAGLLSSNFDQIFNLQNDIIILDTNTINVYTYRTGVKGRQYSIATAVGLFQGAVNCVMLLGANWVSKRLTEYGLF